MTSRALSAWFAVGFCVLAMLVAADRPHWFGLTPGVPTIANDAHAQATTAAYRSAPWRIAHGDTANR